jgi:acetyl-CoA C-acetyltransferase
MEMQTVVAGGVESISLVQNEHMNVFHQADPLVLKNAPAVYMAMIDTAEIVSKRYNISREAQDEYSLQSQQRTFAAQEAGRFNDEIVTTTVTKRFEDQKTKEVMRRLSPSNATNATAPAPRWVGSPRYRRSRVPGDSSPPATQASSLTERRSVC